MADQAGSKLREKPAVKERRDLSDAAKRALAEAEARRRAEPKRTAQPLEIGGPKGPEPTRFGDWEKGGIASDF